MSRQEPVKTVKRALQILDVLADRNGSTSISEISDRLQVSQSTVHRILGTLTEGGYVCQDKNTQRYQLGLKPVALAGVVLNQNELRKQAIAILEDLRGRTQLNSNLAILERGRVFYLARVNGPTTSPMFTVVGRRAPLHATGLGKAMLAFAEPDLIEEFVASYKFEPVTPKTIQDPQEFMRQLEQVKENGYAIDREELIEGINCVAAPVRDATGRVVAGISLSGPLHQVTAENTPELAQLLRDAALELSSKLGYSA